MPRSVDPEEKRLGFVKASAHVIATEGIESATLRRIAKEAGCTTGSLMHYFPDRHSLLLGTLRKVHSKAAIRMRAVSEHQTGLDRLRAVLHEALPLDQTRVKEWKVWLAFWSAALDDRTMAEENNRRYEEWRTVLFRLTEPVSSKPKIATDLLLSFVDGQGVDIVRSNLRGQRLKARQEHCVTLLDFLLATLTGSKA